MYFKFLTYSPSKIFEGSLSLAQVVIFALIRLVSSSTLIILLLVNDKYTPYIGESEFLDYKSVSIVILLLATATAGLYDIIELVIDRIFRVEGKYSALGLIVRWFANIVALYFCIIASIFDIIKIRYTLTVIIIFIIYNLWQKIRGTKIINQKL